MRPEGYSYSRYPCFNVESGNKVNGYHGYTVLAPVLLHVRHNIWYQINILNLYDMCFFFFENTEKVNAICKYRII